VAERYHRPTIMLSEGEEEAKGSGRSVGAFDILGAVEASSKCLLGFGGHRAACGLRLRREHIRAFREAFVAEVAATLGDDLAA
jgi:single-stranded-DNA-specific exonuclease